MNIQLYLQPARVLEAILSILILISINRKFLGIKMKDRPILHRLLLYGNCGWAIYILIDIIIYPLVPLSFDLSQSIVTQGYQIEYPSLLIANILRDFALLGLFCQIWCYFLIPYAIQYGEKKTLKLIRNILFLVIFLIITLVNVWIEKVQFKNSIEEDLIVVGTIGNNFSSYSKYLIPMVLFIIAAGRLFYVLRDTAKTEQNKESRKQIRLLYIGIGLLGISYIWYLVGRTLAVIYGFYNTLGPYLIIAYGLHAFWIISSICIYLSIRK